MLLPYWRVQVTLEGLPGALLAGELARARLLLVNAGQVPLRALRCTAAGPDLHLAAEPDGAASGALQRAAGAPGAPGEDAHGEAAAPSGFGMRQEEIVCKDEVLLRLSSAWTAPVCHVCRCLSRWS